MRVQGVNPLKNYGLFISRGQLNESSTPICFKIKFYEVQFENSVRSVILCAVYRTSKLFLCNLTRVRSKQHWLYIKIHSQYWTEVLIFDEKFQKIMGG